MNTLIIGYGCTLRSDDGIGYLVAEQLMDSGISNLQSPTSNSGSEILNRKSQISDLEPRIEVIARQQLTPDLADTVQQADHVIFIDASAASPPGEVRVEDVHPAGENWGAFAHEMGPDVLLDCVKDLYGKTPRAHLITIGGEKFDIGEGLTPTVQAAIPAVLERVAQLIAK